MKLNFRSAFAAGLLAAGVAQAAPPELAGTALPPPAPAADCLAALEAANTFQRVTAHLEAGGDSFTYVNFAGVGKLLQPWYQKLIEQITAGNLLGERTPVATVFMTRGAAVWDSIGLGQIQAYGISSINLGDDANPLYSCRQILYTGAQKPDGILWDFYGGDLDLANPGAKLPLGTDVCFELTPDLAKIADRLDVLFPELAQMQAGSPVTLRSVLTAASGPMRVIGVTEGADRPMAMMIQVPDRRNVLYALVGMVLSQQPGAKVEMDSITCTAPDDEGWNPLAEWQLKKGTDALVFMTSIGLDTRIAARIAAGETMDQDPTFQHLTAGLPTRGSVFGYYSPTGMDKLQNLMRPPEQRFESKFNQAMAAVMTMREDGALTTTYSVTAPARLQLEMLAEQLTGQILPALNAARGKAQETRQISLAKQLNLALCLYANDNVDQLPPAADFAEQVANYVSVPGIADFVYLAGGADISKFHHPSVYPILYTTVSCLPGNVVVGFVDGHVEVLVMPEFTTAVEFAQAFPMRSTLTDEEQKRLDEAAAAWDAARKTPQAEEKE